MEAEAYLVFDAFFDRFLQQRVDLTHLGRIDGCGDDVLIAAGTDHDRGDNGNGIGMLQRLNDMFADLLIEVLDLANKPRHLLAGRVLCDLLRLILWLVLVHRHS